MKNMFKDGLQNIKEIKLTEREKSLMFANISEHMKVAQSTPATINWFMFFHRTSTVIALIALIFSGAAVVVASSEASLPGDLLYPIKVSVKEPLASALSVSSSAKIQKEVQKATERLKEAEQLSEKGLLNADTRKEIEDRFEKHVEKMDSFVVRDMKEESKKVQKKVKVKTDFEESVLRHTEELDKIKEDLSDDEKEEVEQFKSAVLKTMRDKKEKERNDSRDARTGDDRDQSRAQEKKDRNEKDE